MHKLLNADHLTYTDQQLAALCTYTDRICVVRLPAAQTILQCYSQDKEGPRKLGVCLHCHYFILMAIPIIS